MNKSMQLFVELTQDQIGSKAVTIEQNIWSLSLDIIGGNQ